MFWIIFFIVVFFVWPAWLFIKLARYGQGILRPNFERMQRKIEEWSHFTTDGFFAYNRLGGKLFYYITMLYNFFLLFIIFYFIVHSLAK